ncbi:adenine phosphoribosyltransferase [Demetria terragena]|uniref:adenine phosphoribosyltransferase n=1 Tax=Demetria terragena TaxID=63959 RepID=UPI000362EF8E|nr:adenine phosphoribosyltransferase [Demetria terragena]
MASSIEQIVLEQTRDVADFPSPGVQFKDLSPLFASPAAMRAVVDDIVQRHRGEVDLVCGIEARGFVVGAPVALALDVGFVPVRKAGKLPGEVLSETYALEYGTATIEIQTGAIQPGARVLLLDDVLATGGTASAAVSLLRQAGARVRAFEALLELSFLAGRSALEDVPTHALATV